MEIQVNPADGAPLYLQIVNQVKYLVASGRLGPGEEVPPIRVLASQLRINPNTVARAYLELERAGLVNKRHGAGTFVSAGPLVVQKSQRLKILSERADALLIEARQLGVELEDVIELLRGRQQKLLSHVP